MRFKTRERGSASVELVLVAPVLLLLLAVVVGSGRVVSTKSAVLTIARESARAAADAPDPATAAAIARQRAAEVATGLGLDPSRLRIDERGGEFIRGEPYRVDVFYRVELSDLPALGLLPGSFAVAASHTERTDRYRSR